MNIILLFFLGLIWGSGYVIANYCVRHGVPPLGYAFWQSLGPTALLFLINTVRAKMQSPIAAWIARFKNHFSHRSLFYYLFCGVFGIAFPNTLIYFTSQHLPAGIIGVVVNCVPLFIYPLALLVTQEKFSWKRIFFVLLGVTGVMTIVLMHTHIHSHVGVPWILLVLLTPLSFAGCAVFINAKRPVSSDALSLSVGMLIVSTILITPIVLLHHSFYWFHFPFTIADYLVLLEIILSSIGYVLFFLLIKRAGAVYYSLVNGVVALTSVGWGYLIFHNTVNAFTWFAIVLILTAIVMLTDNVH